MPAIVAGGLSVVTFFVNLMFLDDISWEVECRHQLLNSSEVFEQDVGGGKEGRRVDGRGVKELDVTHVFKVSGHNNLIRIVDLS